MAGWKEQIVRESALTMAMAPRSAGRATPKPWQTLRGAMRVRLPVREQSIDISARARMPAADDDPGCWKLAADGR
jgi:hypothetical protein